ncbi:MAG: hypothetical protein IJI05_01020 [Erysipelotrichaceae bacterium]|nr:hypothetical protein [Erysipelotrichaceae bacterium]
MMVIEVLFPEICCLYSDQVNVEYLQQCLPEAKIVNTHIYEEPYFAKKKPDLVYMGSMPESRQGTVIEKLRPYTERIQKLIEQNVSFLITGNAMDVFGQFIDRGKERIPALGLFDYHIYQDMDDRHNYIFVGEYEDIKIVGYKSTFSQVIGLKGEPLFKMIKGAENQDDGLKENNFMLSSLIGPLLVMNPLFMKKLLKQLGLPEEIAFEEEAMLSYEYRLKQLMNPEAHLSLGSHGV